MISFKELKSLIVKCCKVDTSADLSSRYKFEVEFGNMEERLQEIDEHLHVLAFNNKLESHVPELSDIQLLTEYLHNSDEIKVALNRSSEICNFMIFSTASDKGVMKLHYGNNKLLNPDELSDMCSCFEDKKLEFETVREIITKLPIYQILVVRSFNNKQEKFEYKLYFRSNYEMVSLYKSLTTKQEENSNANSEE